MPRKLLIKSNIFPYHVTGRVNDRENFPVPLDEMWKIFSFEILLLQTLFSVEVHAFVMMPNHFHLLITTPNEEYDLGHVMNYFMSDITRSCHKQSGKTGHLFGSRYYWSIIQSSRYYGHVLKYVYRNPVRAKICEQVEEYEFSTINGLVGQSALPFPIYFTQCGLDLNIPDPNFRFEWIDWLNTPFSKEAEELIKRCLFKKEIKKLVDRKTRLPVVLLENLL